MVNLALLGATVTNVMTKVYLGVGSFPWRGANLLMNEGGDTYSGLDVESVLQEGSSAMQDGGAFANVSEKVDSLGGGSYHILRKFGIYAILISFIIGGILLMFSNSNERSDIKRGLVWKVVGAIIVLGSVALVIFLETAANGLFTM